MTILPLVLCQTAYYSTSMGIWKNRQTVKKDNKELYLSLLGGVCVGCSSSSSLEFDHILPELKLFEISQRLDYRPESVLDELQKCQLLCIPCHRIKTASERTLSEPPHGTMSGYNNHGCRCSGCRSAWASYIGNRNLKEALVV